MIFVILNFLVAFLSSVAIIITIKSSKKNEEPINYYFILILLGLTAQRLFYTLSSLININIENKLNYSFVAYFYVPLFYLFLKNYLKYKISQKENLTHFALASFIVLINLFFEIDGKVKFIIFFIFSTTYIFFVLKKITSIKKNTLLKSKKHWLHIMLFQIFLIYIISNFFLLKYSENISNAHLKYYNFSAIIWLISLTYLFVNPEIFFGIKTLKKIVRTNEFSSKITWNLTALKKIQAYDYKIHDKIAPKSVDIISKIERFIESYDFRSNLPLDFKSISEGININAYHLNYIFKYHCVYSKSDFFNYCKVIHILKLLEDGYLQNKTISSLINDSHFKSKKTFYKNFKKFTGKSPQEMNNTLKFKM